LWLLRIKKDTGGISMTQDVYMGRRAVGSEAAAVLQAHNPDDARPHDEDA
jgi:hypothetical protein